MPAIYRQEIKWNLLRFVGIKVYRGVGGDRGIYFLKIGKRRTKQLN